MTMTVFEITKYDEKEGEYGPFFEVTIKPGGKARIYEIASQDYFRRQNFAIGPYAADIEVKENKVNGRSFMNRTIKNLSKPALSQMEQAVKAEIAANGQRQGVTNGQRQAGADFRTPEQFLRTTAAHEAIEITKALLMFIDPADGKPSEQAGRMYAQWFDIILSDLLVTSIAESPQPVQDGAQGPSGVGPRLVSGSVPTRFWAMAREAFEANEGADWRKATGAWLDSVGYGPFDKLTADQQQEALTELAKAHGVAL